MLLFILPFMVSEIIRIFALRPILSRNGVVNSFLMDLNLIDTPFSVFVFTPTGVVIGEIVSFLPFMIFSTFLALEAIPNYIFEVCSDLGVNRRRMFKDILLPLAAPGLFAGSVFIFVNGIGIALIPTILGGPGAVNAGLIATHAIIALTDPGPPKIVGINAMLIPLTKIKTLPANNPGAASGSKISLNILLLFTPKSEQTSKI
jgi:ABC-type spermidine/putrescine transport system permease subunit I